MTQLQSFLLTPSSIKTIIGTQTENRQFIQAVKGSDQAKFAAQCLFERAQDVRFQSDKLDDLDKTIELDPRFTMAYVKRGHLQTLAKNWDQAIINFNKVLQENPHDFQVLISRAAALYNVNQLDAAKSDVDLAITLQPNLAGARPYFVRSQIRLQCKDVLGALADAQKGLALEPNNLDITMHAASIHSRLFQYEHCERLLNKALVLLDYSQEQLSVAERRQVGDTIQENLANLKPLIGARYESCAQVLFSRVCKSSELYETLTPPPICPTV